jgi:16S rRNA G966 N2-methylase RsmD
MLFFDTFSEFYITSKTGQFPNRLNKRYQALIENNIAIIKDQTILDVASHDGRWAFAALKNGANRVIGIEARRHLVENCKRNMDLYNLPINKYSFIEGDIFFEISKMEPNVFDTVFCFGFFYHTMNHMQLLAEIKRLRPKYLILDTNVSSSDRPIIELKEEDSKVEANGVRSQADVNDKALVGYPSVAALNVMLKHIGFGRFSFYDWHSNISDWQDLQDYRKNERVSLVATNLLG